MSAAHGSRWERQWEQLGPGRVRMGQDPWRRRRRRATARATMGSWDGPPCGMCDGGDVRDPERPTGRVVHGVLGDHGAAVVRRAGRRSVHPRVGDERRRGQLLGPPRSRSHRSSPIIIAGEPGQRRPSAPPIGLGAAVVDLHHQFGKGWGVIIASRTCADAARGPSVTADSQAVVRDLARTGTIAGQS
jgi:hypothetical protein